MFVNKFKNLFALLLASVFALAACGGGNTVGVDNSALSSASGVLSSADSSAGTEESIGAVKDVPAEIALTVSNGGSYTIDGAVEGTVVIDTEAELELVLKNAVVKGTTGPAIYVKNCKKLTVKLEGESTLSDSAEYSAEQGELKGALFSEDDLVFTGEGSLSVTGNRNHAIVSDDGILITSGNVKVVSAVKDGLHANDFVNVEGGTLNVENAGGDAIESEADINITGGALNLNSEGDCIKASLAAGAETDCAVRISGGTIVINTKEDGIQSDGTLDITDGVIDITTTGVVNNNEGDFGGGQMPGGDWGGGQMPGGNWGGGRPQRPDGGNRFPGSNPEESQAPMQGENLAVTQQSTSSANDASSKGIKAAGLLTIKGGTIKITSTDDAVHGNGNVCIENGVFTISADDDAFHADEAITVKGGTITVTKCYEGLEGKTVLVEGGDIDIISSDDGINSTSGDASNNRPGNANADNSITVNGGKIHVAAGGDGVDSNGSLTVNGGILCVECQARGGDNALDADGTRLVNGGVVVALGGTDMLESPSASSKQPVAVIYAGVTAGSTVALTDAEGKVILCYTAEKSATTVTLSAPELQVGGSYTLYTGVTPVGGKTCGGLYYGDGISFTGGTAAASFTQNSIITQSR